MYYAIHNDHALHLGEEAKSDPAYLVRFWTAGEIEQAYGERRQRQPDSLKGPAWSDLEDHEKGSFVQEVEERLEQRPETAVAVAAMNRAIAAAVDEAARNLEEDQ